MINSYPFIRLKGKLHSFHIGALFYIFYLCQVNVPVTLENGGGGGHPGREFAIKIPRLNSKNLKKVEYLT